MGVRVLFGRRHLGKRGGRGTLSESLWLRILRVGSATAVIMSVRHVSCERLSEPNGEGEGRGRVGRVGRISNEWTGRLGDWLT